MYNRPTSSQGNDRYTEKYSPTEDHFNSLVEENYKEALRFLTGSTLYGKKIDLENFREMVAALYIAYKYK